MSNTVIEVAQYAGPFAEDKDVARSLRVDIISPTVKDGGSVVLDFEQVDLATQSFIHALLSEVIRIDQGSALDQLEFKNCNASIRNLVEIVCDYSQDTLSEE